MRHTRHSTMLHCTSLQKPNAHSALYDGCELSALSRGQGPTQRLICWCQVAAARHPPLSSRQRSWWLGHRDQERRTGPEWRGWGRGTERERRHEPAVRSQESHDPGEGHDYPGRWRHPGSSGDQTSTDSIRGHTTGHTLTNIMRKSFIQNIYTEICDIAK